MNAFKHEQNRIYLFLSLSLSVRLVSHSTGMLLNFMVLVNLYLVSRSKTKRLVIYLWRLSFLASLFDDV